MVLVRNLNSTATMESLSTVLDVYGAHKVLTLKDSVIEGETRKYAYVLFSDDTGAAQAI
jgi:hypothetical protein